MAELSDKRNNNDNQQLVVVIDSVKDTTPVPPVTTESSVSSEGKMEQSKGVVFVLLFVFIIGWLQVAQSGINVALGRSLGNGTRSAFISFVVAALVALPVCYPGPPLSLVYPKLRTFPKYTLLGGILGALYVLSTIFIPPVLGFALFFLLVVLGQLSISVVLDHFGILVEKRELTISRVVGILLTFGGVVVVQFVDTDDSSGIGDGNVGDFVISVIFSIFGGACLPLQAICNKKLTTELAGTSIRATFISLLVSVVFLAFPLGFSYIWVDWKFQSEGWWIWLGGVVGAIYVCSAAYFPKQIGVASFFVILICGQMMAALVFDHFGAFDFDRVPIKWFRVLGAGISIFGGTLIRFESFYKQVYANFSKLL